MPEPMLPEREPLNGFSFSVMGENELLRCFDLIQGDIEALLGAHWHMKHALYGTTKETAKDVNVDLLARCADAIQTEVHRIGLRAAVALGQYKMTKKQTKSLQHALHFYLGTIVAKLKIMHNIIDEAKLYNRKLDLATVEKLSKASEQIEERSRRMGKQIVSACGKRGEAWSHTGFLRTHPSP